jgi:23S rRNA (uracil1939-C5)-methyltransferase
MIGKVQTIAKGGAGIVRDADHTVFVPGVISGETVEFSLLGRQKSIWRGKLLRVLEASPQRVEPTCLHAPLCGGCNLQHMSYAEQLRCKTEIMLANLKKIAGVELPVAPGILTSPPWRYRSKSEFQVRDGVGGFFKKESHQVVAIGQCLLLPEGVESFFLGQRAALSVFPSAQLQVVSNGRELAARLQETDGRETWLSRAQTVRFESGPFAYQFAPDNFIQSNLFQLRPMLDLLENALNGLETATAADLFCGCGFFTMLLATRCKNVLALENNPRNMAALQTNLDLNRIRNVRVMQADILHAELPPAALYVADPPRGGLSPAVINALVRGGAETIIYFSCDSATFARDVRFFVSRGFGITALQLIDNFPQSDHFEIFSVLKKK